MFSKDDYKNLLSIVSVATYNGIQAAAIGVSLFHKLQLASVGDNGESADIANSTQQGTDKPA